MRRLTTILCLTFAVLLGSAGEGWSADFQKGLDAYNRADFATALREWRPLAKQGNARAQHNLGLMYENGRGVPQDNETAAKWYRLAAEQGNADAQNNLGWMYHKGQGVPQEDKTAVKWFRLAAEQGYAIAQTKLGWMYEYGQGVPQDDKTAVKWYRLAAEQADALAQHGLGWMYTNGRGVPQDDKTAVKWYTLAAKQGYAVAQFSLGLMYRRGLGVPQDDKTAAKWHRLAAEQGLALSQQNLGHMYERGLGVPQDDKTAAKWYTLAAEQEDALSQYSLGWMYTNGRGVPQDDKTAVKWFTLAAEQGYARAQFGLGWMYANGKGIPRDNKTAVKWWRLSAEQGNTDAQKYLKILQKKIAEQKPSPTVTAEKPNPKVDHQIRLELARRTQEALQVLGLYSGKLDGIIGVKTRSAIQQWQKRNGYAGTGEVTEAQLTKLEQEAITRLAEKEPKPKVAEKKEQPPPTSGTGTSGSGFFVSKQGHILTNEHVVRKCKKVTVGDNANRQVSVKVLETDRRNDLALLKLSSTSMASAETKSLISKLGIRIISKSGDSSIPLSSNGLLRSEDVELGENVMVGGYPYGDIFSNTIKVTRGIVSAIRGMGDDSGQFQMDAAVQAGNSGGPIYDENGNIVGVVISQLNRLKVAKVLGSLPENVNFGIKASTVRQFLTSAGLPTRWSERSKSMSTKELAKIARNQTVMVVCTR